MTLTTTLDRLPSSNSHQTHSPTPSNGNKLTQSNNHESQRRSIYESSSQYRHWRFSAEQLKNVRETLNHAAVAAIRNTFESDEV